MAAAAAAAWLLGEGERGKGEAEEGRWVFRVLVYIAADGFGALGWAERLEPGAALTEKR
jgi:hypothetical protein